MSTHIFVLPTFRRLKFINDWESFDLDYKNKISKLMEDT